LQDIELAANSQRVSKRLRLRVRPMLIGSQVRCSALHGHTCDKSDAKELVLKSATRDVITFSPAVLFK
jgi:hypothetical protein